ncbi:hypothetical protein [Bdellovibrio sp. HCB209]|uniref:hypothetical protein n=1 Tax=Bdellovibrio sp. HCB209 TaxID=3394354 RepID=UPI0039B48493
MNIQFATVIGMIFFSSISFARGDFHSLIESSGKEGKAVQKSVSRMVNSDKSFQGDVVSAKRVRAYNPVTYNPMAQEDGGVEVIVHRDSE